MQTVEGWPLVSPFRATDAVIPVDNNYFVTYAGCNFVEFSLLALRVLLIS